MSTTTGNNNTGQRPVHTVRHRRLKATIWCNATEKGPMYNVNVTRSYRDKDTNAWRDTHSLGYDDLMNVAALLHEARSYISRLIAQESATPAKKAVRRVPKAPARPGPPAQNVTPAQEAPF